MIGFLWDLSPLQWVFIVAGMVMLIPAARNFIAGLGKGVQPLGFTGGSSNNLTSIVHKWEMLNNACVDAGLEEAQSKLHEVFLVLANKRPIDPKPSPPPEKSEKESQ